MIKQASYFVLAASLAPTSAVACAVFVPEGYDRSPQQHKNVSQAIATASAIIDGEVIRVVTARRPALVRVHRVYKGIVPNVVEVQEGNSCSIRLDRPNERMRMILSDGPQKFTLYRDQSEAEIEDELLGSDRRLVWPYFAGDEPSG